MNSCKNFEECYILPDAEKAKMRALARPAYKKWITTDFGVAAADVDALWAEVERISTELDKTWMDSYLK